MSDGEALWVVDVRDQRNAALIGNEAGEPAPYRSPPQTLAAALSLVGVLLGRQVAEPGTGHWQLALAGGRRHITLLRAADGGPSPIS